MMKMAQEEYAQYILGNFNTNRDDKGIHMFRLDENVLKGAPYLDCAWFWPTSTPIEIIGSHSHDFEEVIAFFGAGAQNPLDLGGEIEFWMGEERFILTQSKIIFVPKNVKHCPLIIRKADRPIFHFSFGVSTKYAL